MPQNRYELPGMPLIEIAGEKRVLIENHRGVTEYDPLRICVRVKFGQVCVCGEALTLAQMTRSCLVICGRIDSVTLLRGRE
jgi:sporulation protein YqfC